MLLASGPLADGPLADTYVSAMATGVASATLSFGPPQVGSPMATGIVVVRGQAAATLEFTGSAIGSVSTPLDLGGPLAFGPLANGPIADDPPTSFGVLPATLSASATLDFTADALGRTVVRGSATASLLFTGQAAGSQSALSFPGYLAFGPLADGPLADGPTSQGIAAGGGFEAYGIIPFTGWAQGIVKVTGVAAATFDISGSASAVQGSGSILTASAELSFTATATGRAVVRGRMPDAAPMDWEIIGGVNTAKVVSFPEPAPTPAWSIAVGNHSFTVLDSPGTVEEAAGAYVLEFTGSAAGKAAVSGAAAAQIDFTGSAQGRAISSGVAAGTLSFAGDATGRVAVAGTAAGVLQFTGSAEGGVGDQPARGRASGVLDFSGSATALAIVTGQAAFVLEFQASAIGKVAAKGVALGHLDFTGSAAGRTQFARRRAAFPSESRNGGKLFPSLRTGKLV